MTVTLTALLVACIWGINPIMEKLSLVNATPLTVMTLRFIMTSIVLSLITVFSGKIYELKNLDTQTYFMIITPAVLGALGLFLYFIALGKGDSSKVAPIAATFPLFTAIYAFILLKENITQQRLLGIVLIVIGLVVLNWKNSVNS
jgi:uncharacterized membrane protein